MVGPGPTEPANGPRLELRRADGLPPFAKGAAGAFAAALLPWLTVAAFATIAVLGAAGFLEQQTSAGRAAGDFIATILGTGSMVGPLVAIVWGGRVAARLRRVPEDVRPRGLAMAQAARILGWVTLLLWAFLFAFVGWAMGSFNPG